jgi:hypothetical protein
VAPTRRSAINSTKPMLPPPRFDRPLSISERTLSCANCGCIVMAPNLFSFAWP